MSGKSKTTTNTSQSNSFAPWVTDFGQNLVSQAGDQINAHPWQSYDGPVQGQFGQGWQDASGYLSSLLGQLQPSTEIAGSELQRVMSSLDPSKSVAQFMSPYVDTVLQPTIRNINEANDQARSQLAASQTMAGAYGDSTHATQNRLLERERERSIGDATAGAYDKAFSSAVGQRDSELQKTLAAIGAGGTLGGQEYAQKTGLAQILASLGTQQQQADQTGIQNKIALNLQNQQMPMQQFTQLGQLLAMIPKNTNSQGTQVTSTPDYSGLALLSSLI